jgi:hypothetical protein
MGERSILPPTPAPKKKTKTPHQVFNRSGTVSKVEKELVAQFVADQPTEITPKQITGLAMTLRRSKAVIKQLIEDAKENFVVSADRYVKIHMLATEKALADGDNEQALKGSQWALTNIGAEGARVVDKEAAPSTGTKIMIGLKVGGLNEPKVLIGTKVDDEL